jgi:hypothetical protein
MFSHLSSLARSGVIALAALSSVPVSAPAAPIGPTVKPAVADGAATVIPAAMGEGREFRPGYQNYNIWRRPRGWNGNWNRRAYRNGDWHVNRPWRGHYRRNYWRRNYGPGFALGLGLGVPLGYYGGGYGGYYDNYYDEPVYRPRVSPRRYYNNYRRGYYNGRKPVTCEYEYLTGPKFTACENR